MLSARMHALLVISLAEIEAGRESNIKEANFKIKNIAAHQCLSCGICSVMAWLHMALCNIENVRQSKYDIERNDAIAHQLQRFNYLFKTSFSGIINACVTLQSIAIDNRAEPARNADQCKLLAVLLRSGCRDSVFGV